MADKTAFLETAFPAKEHTKLKNSARNLIAQSPKTALPVFKAIAEYVTQLHSQISKLQASLEEAHKSAAAAAEAAAKITAEEEESSPGPSKKRKLDVDGIVSTSTAPGGTTTPSGNEATYSNITTAPIIATITDISFSIPQRKKFSIILTQTGIVAITPGTQKVEWGVEWSKIKHIVLLPVPEKAARQVNFVIFPINSEGVDSTTSSTDPAVFTLSESTPPKTASGPALTDPAYNPETYQSFLTSILNKHTNPNISVVHPDKTQFQSALPQPHRKSEPAFHVKAHRGTKEGYLWFLENGVLWGFKKPLMFVEFVRVESVSYTSITKRTFNLSIHIHPGGPGAAGDAAAAGGSASAGGEEVEFAMIDQADYINIDTYIRKHRLNDASMAEMRRAVVYNVNKARDADGDGENDATTTTTTGSAIGGNSSAISDLQRAIEQAEEEEEGEDYHPDGESDGSGEDTGDEDDDGSGSDDNGSGDNGSEDEDDEDDDGDLRDELGSELEEVAGGVDDEDEDMSGVAKAIVARRAKRMSGR